MDTEEQIVSKLILLVIFVVALITSCSVEREDPATAPQSTLVLRAIKGRLGVFTESLAHKSYRIKSWLSVLGQKHAYEVHGDNWFTSSLSGAFAKNRSGLVHGKTHSTFGEFSAYSDLGSGLKYDVNQDGFVLFHTPDRAVLTVFDGISTGGNGEMATEVAINTLRNELPNSLLADALLKVRNSLHQHVLDNPSISPKYGVCAAGVEIRGNLATISHVGDVRLLHVRDGKIMFKTRDHNFTWDKVVHGYMTPDEYVQDGVDKSLVEKALRVPMTDDFGEATVDTTTRHLTSGDSLVIASDAVWNLFTSAEINKLMQGRSTEEAVAAIRKEVRQRVGSLKNRDDNFTVAVYHHDPEGLL